MAYGAVASWQNAPVATTPFFADYASQLYPPAVARDVASALVALNASELHLGRAIGHDTMDELWKNPFAPSRVEQSTKHQNDLRQSQSF